MPLTHAALNRASAAFDDTTRPVAVAVSGGSDSLGVLVLAVHAGHKVHAITVNHGLRPAAVAEAAHVAKVCATLDVPHTTLQWEHGRVSGNIMEKARVARYALIADWAAGQGIDTVFLGHTEDDQAETFLMSLARGTGLDGLTGMRSTWTQRGITFARPFLDTGRSQLRAVLVGAGIDWIDDPTNADDRHARTLARTALGHLRPLGIRADKMAETIHRMRMVQSALRAFTAQTWLSIGQERAGAITFPRQSFALLEREVQHRLIAAILRTMSGAGHPARADGIARLIACIENGNTVTLAGCRLRSIGPDAQIARELRAVAMLEAATTAPWDHRWHLVGPHAPDLRVRALGDGLQHCPDWRATGVPRDVLAVTPAIWRGYQLIAAPLAGFPQGWTANIQQSLHASILSH